MWSVGFPGTEWLTVFLDYSFGFVPCYSGGVLLPMQMRKARARSSLHRTRTEALATPWVLRSTLILQTSRLMFLTVPRHLSTQKGEASIGPVH